MDQLFFGAVCQPSQNAALLAFPHLPVEMRLAGRYVLAEHLRTELVLEALEIAVQQRHPNGAIYHSGH